MPIDAKWKNHLGKTKVLLLGSGGLSIGQAGEFDYSGTQAIKAMEEEGIEVIIINPNIATVQTNPDKDRKVYLYPVEPSWVEKVIQEERPSAIVAGFGGQTALNCLLQLEDLGVLKKYNVANLGTPADTLRMTEDRDLFAKKMKELNVPVPPSKACETMDEAIKAGEYIGYPVIIRAAYALGGLGSGFANNQAELEVIVEKALNYSPQVLVEKSLKGWKEVEYEIMRDGDGNAITICNMENFDPLGIHTGDSIVVCPSQSLSDDEYQLLRNASLKMVAELGIVGECNAQFALSPDKKEYFVIEINARLSRSSALASKASGYPIAYIAAKVVMGYSLLELKNPVTGVTFSFFEPALDYITVKIPRWDLIKFRGASRSLGSTMKSVGEVMSIGRSFPEAMQKAVRMVSEEACGLSKKVDFQEEDLERYLQEPTDTRLHAIMESFRQGYSLQRIWDLTRIDKWFLYQLRNIVGIENEIKELSCPKKCSSIEECFKSVDQVTWRRWKSHGFGDEQIAELYFRKQEAKFSEKKVAEKSLAIRRLRKVHGVIPVMKKIDTTAGEYPSPSNYMYMSYGGTFDDPIDDDEKQYCGIILGGGAYRIGTSVEFDWCAVSCSKELQKTGWRSVIINCNPETVSTDYNSSDRLYFEELTLERILDIYEREEATGVIACMGGQLPNKLALSLAFSGIKLLGHSPKTIDGAEDREKFSALLDKHGIDQPRWTTAKSFEDMKKFIEKVGFPVLVRPSYVLSGAAMSVAFDEKSLKECIESAGDISNEHPVVVSEFLLGAREIELDGVAKNGTIITAIVSEHIENAGVHSGDATMVVPAQKLYVETVRQVREAGRLIAKELQLNGPFNIQFLARLNKIKVIECNARASRSFPFVSKVVGLNLAQTATQVILNLEPNLKRLNEDALPYVGVKAAMFSFKRLLGADPVLGVEMASTGEVGCIGGDFHEALILAFEASGILMPKKGILVSIGDSNERAKFLSAMPALLGLGIPLYATTGTADYYKNHGYELQALLRPGKEGKGEDHVLDFMKQEKIDLVINVPQQNQRLKPTFGASLRQATIQNGCSLITNLEKSIAFVQALDACYDFVKNHKVKHLPEYR